jgi:hypothetical protein
MAECQTPDAQGARRGSSGYVGIKGVTERATELLLGRIRIPVVRPGFRSAHGFVWL